MTPEVCANCGTLIPGDEDDYCPLMGDYIENSATDSCEEWHHWKFCPDCGWDERNDMVVNDWQRMDIYVDTGGSKIHWFERKLDSTKIEYVIKPHTNSSQICEGVNPLTATREDVIERVRGTFGGRFEYFSAGRFRYIAYTDWGRRIRKAFILERSK